MTGKYLQIPQKRANISASLFTRPGPANITERKMFPAALYDIGEDLSVHTHKLSGLLSLPNPAKHSGNEMMVFRSFPGYLFCKQ